MVYVNTAQEADGSDSGARPDEAVTWGKITTDATPVKVSNKLINHKQYIWKNSDCVPNLIYSRCIIA